MSELGAAITVLLSLLLWGVKHWASGASARKKEVEDVEKQKVRDAINKGNSVVINSATDRLLSDGNMPTKTTGSDSSPGQHSGSDTAKQISDLLGTKIVFRK